MFFRPAFAGLFVKAAMSIYVSRFNPQTLGTLQTTQGAPIASTTLIAGGSLAVTQPSEAWEITSDAAHTITWDNNVIEQWPAGKSRLRGLLKGNSITVA